MVNDFTNVYVGMTLAIINNSKQFFEMLICRTCRIHVMTTKNLKVLLLLAVMVLITAAISTVTHAQIAPGEDDGTISVPGYTGENPAVDEGDLDAKIDAIGLAIVQLQIQNDELHRYSVDESIQKKIKNNNDTIDDLFAEWDILMPPITVVDISPNDEHIMKSTIAHLMASDLPLFGAGINPSTGMLDVTINANNATSNIEDRLKSIAPGVPMSFIYSKDYPTFQGSCNKSTGFCDPLIGGSKGEDKYWGQDCTVSIAAVRNTGSGTENGIVIPDHCNRNTSQYYQADNDHTSHLVGSQSKDGIVIVIL